MREVSFDNSENSFFPEESFVIAVSSKNHAYCLSGKYTQSVNLNLCHKNISIQMRLEELIPDTYRLPVAGISQSKHLVDFNWFKDAVLLYLSTSGSTREQ
jgi:hypothetical protein